MVQRSLWFDMDGVLCDFDRHYPKITGVSFPHDGTLTEEQKDHKWSLLNDHPNFFLDLPWIPGARTMIAYCMKYAPHSVGILSAASKRVPQSHTQKHEWCKREIPWMSTSNIVVVPRKRDKVNYVGSGNILVDDYDVNISRWREAGGIGIHFQDPAQALTELPGYHSGSRIIVSTDACHHKTGV